MRFGPEDGQIPRIGDDGRFLRIGFDYLVPLCLDEVADGQVIAFEPERSNRVTFINTNVSYFAECLLIFEQYGRGAVGLAESDVAQLVCQIAAEMRRVDAPAFDSIDNFWSLIIEQMHDGLM